MFNEQAYPYRSSPLLRLAEKMTTLELFWPLPLVAAGVMKWVDPLVIGIAIALALLPWLVRLVAFGRLSRSAFIGGPMALLAASAPAALWAAYDPALSWPMVLTLLGSIGLFFAVVNTPLSPRWVSRALVLVASLGALYFVTQYGRFDYPQETGTFARLGQVQVPGGAVQLDGKERGEGLPGEGEGVPEAAKGLV